MSTATTKATIERCSVGIGRQRLEAGRLKKMEGANNGKFEIWIRENGTPEMVPYADGACQEFVKEAVDAILQGTPY